MKMKILTYECVVNECFVDGSWVFCQRMSCGRMTWGRIARTDVPMQTFSNKNVTQETDSTS